MGNPRLEQVQLYRFDAESGLLLEQQQQELERLRRELKRVTTERDILKKAVGYFAKEPS